MLKKQQTILSFLTLLLFCATFFAHAGHYANLDAKTPAKSEQHDCSLCQQNLDSPTNPPQVKPFAKGEFSAIISAVYSAEIQLPLYSLPSLRAPPTSL